MLRSNKKNPSSPPLTEFCSREEHRANTHIESEKLFVIGACERKRKKGDLVEICREKSSKCWMKNDEETSRASTSKNHAGLTPPC
jgi:hypothetical protein